MADRVEFLPLDLVTRAHTGVFAGLDDDQSDQLVDLLAEVFGRGYNDGFVRGVAELGHRHAARQQRERAAGPPQVPGGALE